MWVYNPNTSSGNNEKLGYSICLSDGKKPVFISVGYNINIESALYIALKTSFNNRQPEPVYMADKFSRIKIEELSN
ncbi:MAG: endonuclease V [Candidatus Hodarchaeota archaeon]